VLLHYLFPGEHSSQRDPTNGPLFIIITRVSSGFIVQKQQVYPGVG
jgi:hypothetical protein